MSLPDIFDTITRISTLSQEGLQGLFMGGAGVVFVLGLCYRPLKRWLAESSLKQIETLNIRNASLEAEISRLKENPEKDKLKMLHEKIDQLSGSLWLNHPTSGQVPPFIPLVKRRTRIISVFNLKGGVGKTTITANLAAVISQRPGAPRILVIDADWQGSLTALCTESPSHHSALVQEGRLLHRILETGKGPQEPFQILHHVGQGHLPNTRLLGADGTLSDVEDALLVRWMAERLDHDPRFVLREWLHSESICNKFDLVLIDCPPRLTAASVAALAASDSLLIPVIPDDVSASAVIILLKNLRKHAAAIAPLQSAGIVPNLTKVGSAGLIANHRNTLTALEADAEAVWGEAVELWMDCRITSFTAPDMLMPFPGLGSQLETFRRLAERIHPAPKS